MLTGSQVVGDGSAPTVLTLLEAAFRSRFQKDEAMGVTCKRPKSISTNRCKMRSSLPYCLARGRKPLCPRIRKPLFCRGLRPGARWCNPVEWRIGDSNLRRFPAGTGRLQGREGQNRGQLWQPM
jgi:hypothetical protein